MITVHCFTDLDRFQREEWPTTMCCKPQVGEYVESKSRARLRIVSITHTTKQLGKAKTVKIITREARTSFEKQHHSRWPVVIANGEIKEFTEQDVVSTNKPIQKELF